MFSVSQFKALYFKYIEEFNETLLQPERILSQINSLTTVIRPAIAEESQEKLEYFDFVVGWNGRENDPMDSAETFYPKPLRAHIKARYQSVKDQLAGISDGILVENEGGNGFAQMYMRMMDADTNQLVSEVEFLSGFEKLFNQWAITDSTLMTKQELLDGINTDWIGVGVDPNRKKKESKVQ
jgi:hypothetical protein